jgi:hypothetical protein
MPNAVTSAVTSNAIDRSLYLKAGVGGLATGILTPLMELPVIKLDLVGSYTFALVAVPFAVLVLVLLRVIRSPPWWVVVSAALITAAAFVAAVTAAVWVIQFPSGLPEPLRNMLGGVAGGLVGTAIVVIGLCVLPVGPPELKAWLPMLAIGGAAGMLLEIDALLQLDLVSVLYPVWQAGVAIGLVNGLRSDNASPLGAA